LPQAKLTFKKGCQDLATFGLPRKCGGRPKRSKKVVSFTTMFEQNCFIVVQVKLTALLDIWNVHHTCVAGQTLSLPNSPFCQLCLWQRILLKQSMQKSPTKKREAVLNVVFIFNGCF
jgi:hypothetical protein